MLTSVPVAGLTGVALPGAASAAATGSAAPVFTLADQVGKPVSLAAFRGRPIVLEWNNPGCPFVQKHYRSGNMQKTQAAARAQGAVWLSINSGAPGRQGYMNGAQAAAFVRDQKAVPDAYLSDPKGIVGHLYAAKTTPHMYLIGPTGTLVYQGAIDDRPTADPADLAGARNLVLAALADVKAGRQVGTPESRAYRYSVKYAD